MTLWHDVYGCIALSDAWKRNNILTFAVTVWFKKNLLLLGAVSGEMFRHMQNSEIIRKMTEEFDEVTQALFYLYYFADSKGHLQYETSVVVLTWIWALCCDQTGQRWLSINYVRTTVEEIQDKLLWLHCSSGASVSVQHHLRRVYDGHSHLTAHRPLWLTGQGV